MINRTQAPAISLPSELSLNNIKQTVLTNGLKLQSISGSSQHICELNIIFKAGRFFEKKKMLAGLCAQTIMKGTKQKSAYELAEAFDFYGAAIKFSANMYTAQMSLYCLSTDLHHILPLVKEVLTEAIFPEKEIEKAKVKTKKKLAVQWQKNNYIASQYFNQAIFGESHPFGYVSEEVFVNEINREDVLNHYVNYFQLNKGSLILAAGHIEEKEIALINEFLGILPITEIDIPHYDFSPTSKRDLNIPPANNLQAALLIGMLTIPIKHPDFEDFQILNTVFGGYFGSRLMSNIREEKGYTYGIYSYINPIMETAYFAISTEVGSDFKKSTLHEIEKEINRLKEEEIKEDELEMVKNYMVGQLMKSIDGPLNSLSTLKNFLIFDVDINEINKQLHAINQISAPRLKELAKQYLNFNEMVKVVVG